MDVAARSGCRSYKQAYPASFVMTGKLQTGLGATASRCAREGALSKLRGLAQVTEAALLVRQGLGVVALQRNLESG